MPADEAAILRHVADRVARLIELGESDALARSDEIERFLRG